MTSPQFERDTLDARARMERIDKRFLDAAYDVGNRVEYQYPGNRPVRGTVQDICPAGVVVHWEPMPDGMGGTRDDVVTTVPLDNVQHLDVIDG